MSGASSVTIRSKGVPVDEYEATVRSLFQRTADGTGAGLIVAEPLHINADPTDPMRTMIDSYGAVARRVASEFDAIIVRQQQAFDAALATTSPADWSNDGVHPFLPGHAVIALAYLRAFGFTLAPSSDSKS
jgi:lysophospholipase L1-like esterase